MGPDKMRLIIITTVNITYNESAFYVCYILNTSCNVILRLFAFQESLLTWISLSQKPGLRSSRYSSMGWSDWNTEVMIQLVSFATSFNLKLMTSGPWLSRPCVTRTISSKNWEVWIKKSCILANDLYNSP